MFRLLISVCNRPHLRRLLPPRLLPPRRLHRQRPPPQRQQLLRRVRDPFPFVGCLLTCSFSSFQPRQLLPERRLPPRRSPRSRARFAIARFRLPFLSAASRRRISSPHLPIPGCLPPFQPSIFCLALLHYPFFASLPRSSRVGVYPVLRVPISVMPLCGL